MRLLDNCVWFEVAQSCVLKLNCCDGTSPLREVADLQVSLWLYSAMFLGKEVRNGCMEVTSCSLNAPFYVSGTPFLPSLAVLSGWNS